MSRTVLIPRACGDFRRREFLPGTLACHWIAAGHEISTATGPAGWAAGNIAVMHLDLSVVWMRAWVFFSARERCTRYCGPAPVVKRAQILAREKGRCSNHCAPSAERDASNVRLAGGLAALLRNAQ